MRRSRMFWRGMLVATVLWIVPASGAQAARPNNQACLGKDASAFAKTGLVGKFVSATATSAPKAIGTEVQMHLAGNIPDTVFPNSCND